MNLWNRKNTERGIFMGNSIYEMIRGAVTAEGYLSENFRLPDDTADGQLKFAPGAMDGILFYHTAGTESEDSEGYTILVNAIESASEGRTDEAFCSVETFAAKYHVLGFIDLFQEYVIENKDRLSVGNVIDFAVRLMMEGIKVEAVKFGMSLLELIDWEGQERLKSAVRLLALSDELTLYAAFLMRCWENPNRELFDILQKVEGWGRVHIVRMIEADSEDIEEWLVRNGVHNDVVPAYSGMDCFGKVHYLERIQSPALDLEIYRGLADILDAMLDEGPVTGISALEDPEEVMRAFLTAAKARTDLEAQDYTPLIDLKEYMEQTNQESPSGLYVELTDFLQSGQVQETMRSALERKEAFEVARRLGMDYQEYAFRAVTEDFVNNAWIASCLVADGYKVEEIIDLAYDRLDVERIATGAGEELGLGDAFEAHRALTLILQELRNRVNVGEKLIRPALKSPVVSNRHMALSALEGWTEQSGQALQELLPKMAGYLEGLLAEEVREDLRQRMEQILGKK